MWTTSIVEEILIRLLWAGDKLLRPTFASLTAPFEAWERRHVLRRQLHRLEQRQLLIRKQHEEQ